MQVRAHPLNMTSNHTPFFDRVLAFTSHPSPHYERLCPIRLSVLEYAHGDSSIYSITGLGVALITHSTASVQPLWPSHNRLIGDCAEL